MIANRLVRTLLLATAIWLGAVPVARASQPMVAVADDVVVYDSPVAGAQVLRQVFRGTPFAASNAPIEGFYKVKASDGVIGFVHATDLGEPGSVPGVESSPSPDRADSPLPELDIVPPPMPRQAVAFWAGSSYFLDGSLHQRLGNPPLHLSLDLGVEFSRAWTDRVRWLARVDVILLQGSLVNSVGSYELNYHSVPLSVGLEVDLSRGEKWRVALGMLMGLGLFSGLDVALPLAAEPHTTVLQTMPFVQTVKLEFSRSMAPGVGVFMETGWRFLLSSSVLPTSIGNGYQSLDIGGVATPLDLGLSGPFGHLGLSWGFN